MYKEKANSWIIWWVSPYEYLLQQFIKPQEWKGPKRTQKKLNPCLIFDFENENAVGTSKLKCCARDRFYYLVGAEC